MEHQADAHAVHEKLNGTNAKRAPRCRAPIQSKEGQAMGEAVDQDLVAAMRGMGPVNLAISLSRMFWTARHRERNKKSRVWSQSLQGDHHIGLLVNEPPGQAGLLFI